MMFQGKREKFIIEQRKAQIRVILEKKRVFDVRTYTDMLYRAIQNNDQDEALEIQNQILNNYHVELVKQHYAELALRQLQLNFEKCYSTLFILLTELLNTQQKLGQDFFDAIIQQVLDILHQDLDTHTQESFQIFVNALINLDGIRIQTFCDSGLIQRLFKLQQQYRNNPRLIIHRVILDTAHLMMCKDLSYIYNSNLIQIVEKIAEWGLENRICNEELRGCLMYTRSARITELLNEILEGQQRQEVAFVLEIMRIQETKLTKQQVKKALNFNVRRIVEEVVRNYPKGTMDVDINYSLYDSFIDHSSDLHHQRLLSSVIDIHYFTDDTRTEYIQYVFYTQDEEMIRNLLLQFQGEEVLEFINYIDALKDNRNFYSDELIDLAANLISEHGYE